MTKATLNFVNLHFHDLEFSGHAFYAEYGNDIVCSAISTALFTAINTMEAFDKTNFKLKIDEDLGLVILNVLKESPEYDKIIEGLINVLKQIAEDYPQNFKLKITTRR